MASAAGGHPAPRARAVPGAPVEALLGRADQLARRWAIALILALPLDRIGDIPLQAFAREATALCARVLCALRSDEELQALLPPGAAGAADASPLALLAEMRGLRDGGGAVEALEALRGVLWEALVDEIRCRGDDRAPAREVADVGDRLAYVCSTALASVLADTDAPERSRPQAARVRSLPERPAAPPASAPAPAPPPPAASIGAGVVIIDEALPHAAAPRQGAALADGAMAPEEALHVAPGARASADGAPAVVATPRGHVDGSPPVPSGRRAGGDAASGRPARGRVAAGGEPAERAAELPGRRPRPLPWDTPLQGERRASTDGSA